MVLSSVTTTTNPVTANGPFSSGPTREKPAAFPLGAPFPAPDPGGALPVDAPPAFCDPGPFRPGPLPAPAFMNASAPLGIAGSSVLSTIQLASRVGHGTALLICRIDAAVGA